MSLDARRDVPFRFVGPYGLLRKLGSGSSGQVFLAKRKGIERSFALKVLPANLDPEGRARLEREARVASRLEHPGLVRVVDIGDLDGRPYLVMEHVPGPTLQEWLQSHGQLPWQDAVELVRRIAEAMQAAHKGGVIHRDLKPANIILDERDGAPRVMDFGLAHDTGDLGLTAAGDQLGTPYYMAPEQVRGSQVDHRCDIYALGVILYELLAGRRPYEASNVPELYVLVEQARPLPLEQLRDDLPPGLDELCRRVFAKDRDERPSDLGELLLELERISGGGADGESPPRAAAPGSARAGVGVLTAAVLAIVSLLCVGIWSASWATEAAESKTRERDARKEADDFASDVVSLRAEADAREGKLEDLGDELARISKARGRLHEEVRAAERELAHEATLSVEPLGTLSAAIDRVIEELRERGVANSLAANLLRNRGRYVEAAELAAAAWQGGDRDLELLVVEFRGWQTVGARDRSMPAIQKLLRQADPESPQGVFARAVTGGLGPRQQVITRLEQVAEVEGAPGYLWILAARLLSNEVAGGGGVEMLRHQLRVAERAVAADPCCPDAREVRVSALMGLRGLGAPAEGDLGVVLQDCRLAREINPETQFWFMAGQMLVLGGQADAARAELAEARRRAQEEGRVGDEHARWAEARAGVWLAIAHLEGGEDGDALAILAEVLRQPGVEGVALELRGFLDGLAPTTRTRLLDMVTPDVRRQLEVPR